MHSLNRELLDGGTLDVVHTAGAPIHPITILQVGDGNFLRGFVDWMVDVANGQGLLNDGVAIVQPLDKVIAAMNAAWSAHAGDPQALVAKVLADTRLWGEDLTRIPGLALLTANHLAAIEAKGVKATMAELIL
jgi:mannitol-1-phosphate/altronate dehydrogenase